MSVVFLEEGYDLAENPNSICLKNLITEYSKYDNDYYIVCDGYVGWEAFFSKDSHIIHVKCKKESSIDKKNIFQKIITIATRILHLAKWPVRFPKKTISYVNEIENKIDLTISNIIIAFYKPAEMVEVAKIIKKRHPNNKIIFYSLDGFENNFLLFKSKFLRKKELTWMKESFSVFDKIIQMKCHKKKYEEVFPEFEKKTRFLDFPLVVENPYVGKIEKNDNRIHFLYAGSFYKNIREPYQLIEWFSKISKDKNYTLDIYTKNDFVDYINSISEINDHIIRHDYVSNDEMLKIIAKSDVLVSVGNKNSSMVPSKIFNYISSGKPIVHLYEGTDDSCLEYLEKYKNVTFVKKGDFSDINVLQQLEFSSIKNDYLLNFPKATLSEFYDFE